MHRFFVSQLDVVDDVQALICSEDLVHQFTKVLRFGKGEQVILLDGKGKEFLVELQELGSKKIIAKVLSQKKCETELPIKLVVAQSLLKNFERFEWVLQKGTELGVSVFVPMITDRTERKFAGKTERMQRILKEAAEQSGRGMVPEICEPMSFEEILKKWKFILMPELAAGHGLIDFLKKFDSKVSMPGEILICVGPEGGFSEREVEMAKRADVKLVFLGKRTLRSETASILTAGMVAQWIK